MDGNGNGVGNDTESSHAAADPAFEEDGLREALEAGLVSLREDALIEARVVERVLHRELDEQCERAERRKVRVGDGRGGGGRR
jgi:hypothetical protein